MAPAARLTDLHVCPLTTPGTPPVPHAGGPIVQTSEPTVLIGGLPAARVGDLATCVGSVDTIVQGSSTVLIGGLAAVRMGDATAHGGTVTSGCVNVIIGG
jgi:uncharacterized Zn-binding protein involved in type VI secretion